MQEVGWKDCSYKESDQIRFEIGKSEIIIVIDKKKEATETKKV